MQRTPDFTLPERKNQGRGRPKKYDKKLEYAQIPQKYLLSLPEDHNLQEPNTKVWALQVYADTIKEQLIQVVIIQRSNPKK
ncbi:hypothetical protein [Eisenibacter elegans]|uniref:hypothetical protein n=1 Tax=Eisenibacter elegans TaxID=997 RepID=UPI000428B8EC|nr:hypothetical protein [Eisenibacter elegans]